MLLLFVISYVPEPLDLRQPLFLSVSLQFYFSPEYSSYLTFFTYFCSFLSRCKYIYLIFYCWIIFYYRTTIPMCLHMHQVIDSPLLSIKKEAVTNILMQNSCVHMLSFALNKCIYKITCWVREVDVYLFIYNVWNRFCKVLHENALAHSVYNLWVFEKIF